MIFIAFVFFVPYHQAFPECNVKKYISRTENVSHCLFMNNTYILKISFSALYLFVVMTS